LGLARLEAAAAGSAPISAFLRADGDFVLVQEIFAQADLIQRISVENRWRTIASRTLHLGNSGGDVCVGLESRVKTLQRTESAHSLLGFHNRRARFVLIAKRTLAATSLMASSKQRVRDAVVTVKWAYRFVAESLLALQSNNKHRRRCYPGAECADASRYAAGFLRKCAESDQPERNFLNQDKVNLSSQENALIGADPAAAASQLSQPNGAYQAELAATARVLNLPSLLNFLQ